MGVTTHFQKLSFLPVLMAIVALTHADGEKMKPGAVFHNERAVPGRFYNYDSLPIYSASENQDTTPSSYPTGDIPAYNRVSPPPGWKAKSPSSGYSQSPAVATNDSYPSPTPSAYPTSATNVQTTAYTAGTPSAAYSGSSKTSPAPNSYQSAPAVPAQQNSYEPPKSAPSAPVQTSAYQTDLTGQSPTAYTAERKAPPTPSSYPSAPVATQSSSYETPLRQPAAPAYSAPSNPPAATPKSNSYVSDVTIGPYPTAPAPTIYSPAATQPPATTVSYGSQPQSQPQSQPAYENSPPSYQSPAGSPPSQYGYDEDGNEITTVAPDPPYYSAQRYYKPLSLGVGSELTSVWTTWSTWSFCREGSQVRVRGCYTYQGFQCSGPRSEDRRCNQETGGPIEQPDKQWSFGGSGPYGQPQSGGDQYSQQQSNYGSQTASSPPAYINQNPIYNQQATQANSYQQSPTLPQPPPTQSNYNRPQPTSATSYTSDDSSYQSNRHDNYNSQPTGQSYNQPTAQPYNNQQAYNPQPPPATSSYNQPQPTNSYNPGPTPAYTSQPAAYNKPSSSAYNNPQPAPSYSSQPPAYNNPQPTPSYSSQPPTYNKPSISAYNNPQPIPSYSNNQPAEQPSYQAETPAYSQPAGSYPSSQVTNSPPANSYGSQPGAYGPPPSVLQALAYSAIGPQQFQKAIEDQYWASQGINPSGVGNVKYSPARPYVYGESPGPLPAHANTYSSGPASNSGGYGQSAGSYQPSNRGYQATTEPNTLSLSPGYGIQQVLTPTGVVYGKANEGAFAPGFRLQKGFAPGYGPNPNQPGGAARSYGPSGPAAPVPAETSYGSAQAQPSYSGFAPGFRLANPTSQPSSSYGSSGATGVTGVGQPPAFRPDSNDNLPAGAPAFVPQPLNGYGGGSRPSSGPSSYPSGPIKTYSAGSYGPSNILDSQAGGYPPALQPPQPQNSYSPVAPYQPPAQVPRVSYSSYGGKPQTEYRKLDSPISTQTNNTASSHSGLDAEKKLVVAA